MLQYAVPNAPHQQFQQRRPSSVFADPPPSTISVHSVNHPRQQSIGGQGSDISLATLASLAASAPAAVVHNTTHNSGDSTRSSTPTNMSQSAPAATAGYGNQNGSAPPICANCQTSTTPLWRRDESGSVLCNACGLFLKLHGRPRPISLKTDVIKSRNRVKASQQTKKRDSDGNVSSHLGNGYHADVGLQHGLPMGSGIEQQQQQQQQRAVSPRSQTPGLHSQHSNTNIAPQHIFDTVSVSLPSDTFASPSMPHLPLQQQQQRPPTPSQNGSHTSAVHMQAENESLRTRVSELEVINDLFRGRVSELEDHEQQYRQRENAREEEAQRLSAELATAQARTADLERKVDEMMMQLQQQKRAHSVLEDDDDEPARKRARTDGSKGTESASEVDSAQAGTW